MPQLMDRYTLKDFPEYSVDVDKAVVYRYGKPLKPFNNGTGYQQLYLCKNGKKTVTYLHHVVYCAKRAYKIMPFRQRLKVKGKNIHHINGDTLNNSYSNLKLVSFLENHYLRKYHKLPYCLINKVKKGYYFKHQSNGKRVMKYWRKLDYLIELRNRYLRIYYPDVYKEVMRIEKKYSRNIKSFRKKNKLPL